MPDLRDVFDKRAASLNDHDPWRYGEALSEKTDYIEIEWVANHMNDGSLLDIGCGTGRHCIELAKRHKRLHFDCFDFAPNNISVLKRKQNEEGVKNID